MTTQPVKNLVHLSVAAFLDRLGERASVPGRGAVAALAGASACAVARGVIARSREERQDSDSQARLAELGAQLERAERMLRDLVDEDAAACERLAGAERSAADGTADPDEPQRALLTATAVCLETAAVGSAALAVLNELGALAVPSQRNHVAVAAVLAEAGVRAAAHAARASAAGLTHPDQRRQHLARIHELVAKATESTRAIEAALLPELGGT
jgi:formiminotetrahydrofolate cyclodeaminase